MIILRYFFLFLHINIRCGFSLEAPQRGASNEYPQHMVLWRTGENYPRIITKYSSLTIPLHYTEKKNCKNTAANSHKDSKIISNTRTTSSTKKLPWGLNRLYWHQLFTTDSNSFVSLHFDLSSAAVCELAKLRPVQSLMLSSIFSYACLIF